MTFAESEDSMAPGGRATAAPQPQHTPGPWSFQAEHLNSLTIRAASRVSVHELGWEIATVYNEAEDKVTATMNADARLIAAAPELLAALEEIAKGEGAFSRDPLEHASNVIEHARSVARAAIAKARATEAKPTP